MVLVYLFIAAAIATFIRFADYPYESITKAQIVKIIVTFVGNLIAAFLMLFALDGTDVSIFDWNGFVVVTMAALGGIGTATALMSQYTKSNPEVVPPNA
jgi:uncharacterized protein YacL